MSETPIYGEAFEAACDSAMKTDQEDLLDTLERMDSDTKPISPVYRAALRLEAR